MIDFISLKIPFFDDFLNTTKDGSFSQLKTGCVDRFRLPMNFKTTFDDNGRSIHNATVPWNSVASDFSTLAMKVHLPREIGFPTVEIKASPAKLMRGHNLYGSECILDCMDILIDSFVMQCSG